MTGIGVETGAPTINLGGGWEHTYFNNRSFQKRVDPNARDARLFVAGAASKTGQTSVGLPHEANRVYAQSRAGSLPGSGNVIPMPGPVDANFGKPYHLPPAGLQSGGTNTSYSYSNVNNVKATYNKSRNINTSKRAPKKAPRMTPYASGEYGPMMREKAMLAGNAYHTPAGPRLPNGMMEREEKAALNWMGRNGRKLAWGAGIAGLAISGGILLAGVGVYAGGTYLASNMSSHPTNRERYMGSQGAY